jgi:flagellar biosynthesis protein FlhF
MRPERFRGADLPHVAERARRTLGDDVMILHVRTVRDGGVPLVEVLAAPADAVARVRRALEPAPLPVPVRARGARPYVIALVGPTGAGKTTTAAKLAVREGLFGLARTGLLTLDTYRVGGMEQLATYADLAGLPFEVAYEARELAPAMQRLAACDVVIVDTPGRSPAAAELTDRWRALLDQLAPDEVHLCLPATTRPDLALELGRRWRDARRPAGAATPHRGATHLVVTKLDEVPGERGVAELALSLDLPVRWVTDGQEVPADLRPGAPRLVRAYGLGVDAEPDWVPA